MRLIDADELKPSYVVTSTTTNSLCHLYVSIEDINSAPTISPVRHLEWIPCSERLPEVGEICLLTVHEYGWNCEDYTRVIIGEYNDNYSNHILAWMPLPKPYRKGGNDNKTELCEHCELWKEDNCIGVAQCKQNIKALKELSDLVEVVQCKDCKHSLYDELIHERWCNGKRVEDDDFCSYGEREEDEID